MELEEEKTKMRIDVENEQELADFAEFFVKKPPFCYQLNQHESIGMQDSVMASESKPGEMTYPDELVIDCPSNTEETSSTLTGALLLSLEEPPCPKEADVLRNIDEGIKDFIINQNPQVTLNKRCSVCLKTQDGQRMKFVSHEEDKLVIMIGCVFLGDYTIDEAIVYMNRKGYRLACHCHFFESVKEIFKILDVRHFRQLQYYSLDLMQNLMLVVNAVWPNLTAEQFRQILITSTQRNVTARREIAESSNDTESNKEAASSTKRRLDIRKPAPMTYHCSICCQMQTEQHLNMNGSEDEKLMIMVGRVLDGETTVEHGKLLIAMNTNTCICHEHYSAIDEIFKVLEINSLDEIFPYQSDQMRRLMVTVNAFRPGMKAWQFCHVLAKVLFKISRG